MSETAAARTEKAGKNEKRGAEVPQVKAPWLKSYDEEVPATLTYSEKTLRLLKEHLFALKAEGRSLAREITSRSVCSCGFSSLEQAEAFLAARQDR